MSTLLNQLKDGLPASFLMPQAVIAADDGLSEMLRKAFAAPIDYPALADSIFPGDQIAIALHPDVPAGREVALAVIDYLVDLGIEPADVLLVTAQRMNVDTSSVSDLPDQWQHVVHNKEDEATVSYLAANQAGQPVKINRTLFDADVIIPITCRDNLAWPTDIYPEFSDAETIERFRQTDMSEVDKKSEIRLANEHLGVFVSLNIIGGPGNEVRAVEFGEKQRCDEAAESLAREIWTIPTRTSVPLVIATLEDEPESQTWQQFCAALVAANEISPGDGQIVVCSELKETPEREMRELLMLPFEVDQDALWQQLDAIDEGMQQVVRILMNRQVFLQSNLRESIVEELGLGPVNGWRELNRLVERAEAGVLLRDAHKIKFCTD